MTVEHAMMVKALSKSGKDILESLTPGKIEMWHHASCIQGEAGELFDAVKKHIIYNKPMTVEMLDHIIEEFGDLEFYLEGLRQAIGIAREQTLNANIAKLSKRYQAGTYSDKAAQERADKVPAKTYQTLSD